MSEHGSNCSIEELGTEELEEGGLATVEPVGAEESGDKSDSPAKPPPADQDDDPPLEVMEPVAPAAADAAPPPAAVEAPAASPPVRAAAPPAAAPSPSQNRGLVSRRAPAAAAEEDDEEEDDDDIDETLTERLIGLTEMFPESLRCATVSLVEGSWSLTKSGYSFSRSAAWVIFSTATLLFMPIMIETERLAFQDQQKQQKTQMLLGPGVGVSGGPALGPPPI